METLQIDPTESVDQRRRDRMRQAAIAAVGGELEVVGLLLPNPWGVSMRVVREGQVGVAIP